MMDMLKAAKLANREGAALTTQQKNAALEAMADALIAHQANILSANESDIARAKDSIASVMLDRLRLTPERIKIGRAHV